MMQTYSTAPMAMVTRGGEIESVHDGWAVLVNAAGVVIKNWGDAEVPIYPRSALKPLQSLYLLACGCKLDDQQLALASASHHAELCHTDRVLAWLDQLGAGEASLACGADWPGDRTRRSGLMREGGQKRRIFHNCSGKHCGQLHLCEHLQLDHEGYQQPDHPIQRQFLEFLADLAGHELCGLGIDGCTLPAPRMKLVDFARAQARLIAGAGSRLGDAADRLIQALIAHPALTGGSHAPNSLLTRAGDGCYFAKNGAEGVYVVLAPDREQVLALKIKDGAMRAAEVAIASLIARLGWADAEKLASLHTIALANSAGTHIGICQGIAGTDGL